MSNNTKIIKKIEKCILDIEGKIYDTMPIPIVRSNEYRSKLPEYLKEYYGTCHMENQLEKEICIKFSYIILNMTNHSYYNMDSKDKYIHDVKCAIYPIITNLSEIINCAMDESIQ